MLVTGLKKFSSLEKWANLKNNSESKLIDFTSPAIKVKIMILTKQRTP